MKSPSSSSGLHCSFCKKSQDTVGKLISSPDDYPRAYICDECIAVCNCIIEDDRKTQSSAPEAPPLVEENRFAQHPLALEFLAAAERWATRETASENASEDLDQMRTLAARILAQDMP